MKIWWCQEHDQLNRVEDCWWAGTFEPKPCRMVPMRLIPDNAETVERLALMVCRQPANAEGHNLECRDFAQAILAHLSGETP